MDRGPGAVKRPSSPSRFPERLAQVRREVHSHHCPRLLPVGESPTGYGVVFVETPAGAVLSLRRWQPGCDSTVGWPQDCAALSLRSILEGKTYLLSPAGLGADFTEACNRKNACLQPSQGCGQAFLSSRTTGPPSRGNVEKGTPLSIYL